MALLTQKAYAQRIGRSAQYVNKLVAQRRIVLVDGKIDARKADAALRATSSRLRRLPHKAAKKIVSVKKFSRPAPREARPKPPKAESATGSLYRAKATRESFLALQAELDYKKNVGELLPAAEVLEAQRTQNAVLRARLRRLAPSLAPTLAPLLTPAEVEAILRDEIDLVLTEMATDPLGERPPARDIPVQTIAQAAAIPIPPVNEPASEVSA